MSDKEKRLNEVYEHLHNHFGVHTKAEFADSINRARAYISSAMNGNEKYLTDKLFRNICEAYPGVFNLDYLLTGEGDLLTLDEDVISERIEKTGSATTVAPPVNVPDLSSTFNASISAYVQLTNRLTDDLKRKDQEMSDRLADKDTIIAEKQSRIVALEQTVADKDAIIRAREERIRDLERRIAQANADDLSRYPFAIGAAEDNIRSTIKQ